MHEFAAAARLQRLLQACYKVVARLLQGHYKVTTRLHAATLLPPSLQGYSKVT